MWRWQQSVRNRLWRHIIASCALIHGILLCLLFLVYRGTVDNYLIYTSSALTTQQVILLPLHKVVSSSAYPGHRARQATADKGRLAQSIDTHSEVVERSSSAKATADRQTPVQESKATTLASSNKKKLEKKKRTKKNARDKKSKKNVRAKKNKKQTKEKEAAKPEVKKTEEKKVEEHPPAPRLRRTEEMPAEKPAKPSEAKHFLRSRFDSMSEGWADAQSAIYVGQLEYEALQLQEAMQQELQQHWKPPIGSTGLTCVVRIMLDWQGAISDVIIEQPSGVLMFDMSAEQAIYVMTFPKTAWGKQVTITFS